MKRTELEAFEVWLANADLRRLPYGAREIAELSRLSGWPKKAPWRSVRRHVLRRLKSRFDLTPGSEDRYSRFALRTAVECFRDSQRLHPGAA